MLERMFAIKIGSIQVGYRPIFIISDDKNNLYSPTSNVIPITSKLRKKKFPIL